MWTRAVSNDNAIVFTDGRYKLRLCAYAPNIMRVTQTGHDEFILRDDPMIVAKAEGIAEVAEAEGGAVVDCGELMCRINLNTGALEWFCSEGDVVTEIMREPEKGGRVMREIDIISHKFEPDSPIIEYQSVVGARARVEGTPYADRRGYQTRLSFVFDDDEDIFGLGQHEQGVLNYRGSHQFLYQHNLKISSPVIMSSKGWGLLSNCCSAQIFHDDAFGSYISADAADEMDYFVIYGPDFDRMVGAIRHLTGDTPMLPRWTLGYVQSKEHYSTGQELVDVAAEYRRRGIPLDCVVQDWQSWPEGQWGQKTVDKERYPDLKATTDKLHDMDVRLMWSIWPNMNGDCPNQMEFLRLGQMLGNRRTFDAFNPEACRTYWKQCREELFPGGVDAWWCDCSEPFEADWYGEVEMLPEDRMYFNVDEFKRYIDPTQILSYSINHSRGMYKGQRAETDEKRVVNLTRSGLTGQQRYATICWNGDTSATWDVLRRTVPDGLNLMLTGLPYWTVDAGGFFVKSRKEWFGRGEYERGCEDENLPRTVPEMATAERVPAHDALARHRNAARGVALWRAGRYLLRCDCGLHKAEVHAYPLCLFRNGSGAFRAFHADENAGIRLPHGCGCAQYFRSVHVRARAHDMSGAVARRGRRGCARCVPARGLRLVRLLEQHALYGRAMAARECAAEQYTDIRARRLDSTDRHGRQVRGGSDVRPAADAIRIRRRGRAVYAVQRRGRRIRIRARRVCHGYLRMA